MAGNYVEILNPGYSMLWTLDLPYLAGSGDVAGTNPLNPDDARALIEGEWLELVASGNKKRLTRGGNNAMSASGTPDGEGSNPAFLYFQERGRYDAQATKLAHVIMGPHPLEIRTKLAYSTGLSVNSRVAVFDWDGRSGAFGVVRRVLAPFSSGYSIGRVSRIYGTDDIAVILGI